MIEPRLVEAIASLIGRGALRQHACLIGGQAIHDLQAALDDGLGGIPPARTSTDIDLLIAFRADARADQAIAEAIAADWTSVPRPGTTSSFTYAYRADPTVQLDIGMTYEKPGEAAQTIVIRTGGRPREVTACRIIPLWLMQLNLSEPCHTPALHGIGLERLRHTALLVTKLIAVHASLVKLASPDPPAWTARLDRDLADVLYLVALPLRRSLWCAPCVRQAAVLRDHMRPVFADLQTWGIRPPPGVGVQARKDLEALVDGHHQWWRS